MDRNSIGYIRYVIVLLTLSAIFGGIAAASVENAVPARPQEAAQEDDGDPSGADDESGDGEAVEDQAGFNTLEDMLLFQGPLATLWAAPQPTTASVKWLEITPEPAAEAADAVADESAK